MAVVRFIILCLLGSFLAPSPGFHGRGSDSRRSGLGLKILRSDASSLVIELILPAISIDHRIVGAQTYTTVSIKDFGRIFEPGAPQLPQRAWLLAVPPASQVRLETESEEVETLPSGRILPAPTMIQHPLETTQLKAVDQLVSAAKYTEDAAIYCKESFYPSSVTGLGFRGRLRDQTFVQVLVRPVQYNPVVGILKYTRRLKLIVTFDPMPPKKIGYRQLSPGRRKESPLFERVLRRCFLNYEVGMQWRSPPPLKHGRTSASRGGLPSGVWYKVMVSEDGIYCLTTADLHTVGAPIEGLDPRTIRLFNRGREVAILVEGEADGRLDKDDRIFFFGQKAQTKYTDTNVYWLTFGGETGRRMTERDARPSASPRASAFTATLHLERDLIYQSRVPAVEGADHWYWDVWPSRDGSPLSYTAQVRDLARTPFMATLRVQLQGFTTDSSVNPDHHVQLYVNGQLLQDVFWDGASEQLVEVSFPQALLIDGENEIRVQAPGDTGAFFDQGLVDWLEIAYAGRFVAQNSRLRFRLEENRVQEVAIDGFNSSDLLILDITHPSDPGRLIGFGVTHNETFQVVFRAASDSGKEYIAADQSAYLRPVEIVEDAPSTLRATDNAADYILITHRDFYPEVVRLAEDRADQGLRTMVVDVQDIYDEFSAGIFTPEAIRSFLATAYEDWKPPAPSFVLLVGDGTFDFKDNWMTGDRTFVPPMLRMVSPFLGEAASENHFVTISGDDILPDMFIGRLPVNTPDEARAVIDKILGYENQVVDGNWNRHLMFVADNADRAGPFDSFSDTVADEHLPSRFEREKVYLGVTHATPDQARSAILTGFNQGRLLVNYVGHSFFTFWAHERLLDISDLGELKNEGRLPLVIGMSSLDGFFHFPGMSAMSETFLRANDKGVIGWWGGAGLGLAEGHRIMDAGFFDAVFRDDFKELGVAAEMGLIELYNHSPAFNFLIDTYVLLGDPALKLAVPSR